MNGYTESEEKINDRMNRSRLANIEAIYGAGWEGKADVLRIHIEAADTLDWIGEVDARAADDEDNRRTQEEARL